MNDTNKYIVTYSNCIPVKGANRSIICDLQRQNYTFVSNVLVDLFFQDTPFTLKDLYELVESDSHSILKEYYDFLIENEFIFLVDYPEISFFPKMSLDWDFPAIISNMIIDIKDEIFDFDIIAKQIEELGCRNIQIRFFKNYTLQEYSSVLSYFENSTVQSMELYIPFTSELTFDKLNDFVVQYKRIKILIVYDTVATKLMKSPNQSNMGSIYFVSDNISDKISCGNISKVYFSLDVNHFSESQQFNTCLNRKISIDINGFIKNCPSMNEDFGNIKDTTLEKALNKPNFKKYWGIKKDEISVCKDCEFRHICTDCRAYTEDINDIYSKPLKCGYNPYTNEWEEWSKNPLKQNAIKFYGMTELVANL